MIKRFQVGHTEISVVGIQIFRLNLRDEIANDVTAEDYNTIADNMARDNDVDPKLEADEYCAIATVVRLMFTANKQERVRLGIKDIKGS